MYNIIVVVSLGLTSFEYNFNAMRLIANSPNLIFCIIFIQPKFLQQYKIVWDIIYINTCVVFYYSTVCTFLPTSAVLGQLRECTHLRPSFILVSSSSSYSIYQLMLALQLQGLWPKAELKWSHHGSLACPSSLLLALVPLMSLVRGKTSSHSLRRCWNDKIYLSPHSMSCSFPVFHMWGGIFLCIFFYVNSYVLIMGRWSHYFKA